MTERPAPEVLVVDDDEDFRRAVARNLTLEGFSVREAPTGSAALEAARDLEPAVIVLDVTMPGLDGVQVTRRLRGAGNDVPILILSARDGVEDRITGLEAGADDYLVKPFDPGELVARLRAILRRRPDETAVARTIGDLRIDPACHEVTIGGRPVELSNREFELLLTFASHPGKVLSRVQLLDKVWGYSFDVQTNVVDVFVGYLRRKLEADGEPRVILTVRGRGFMLRA